MEDYALDVMIGKGPTRADAAPEPQAVHGRRGDDAGGPDQRAAARPVRGDLPARLLRGGRARGDRPSGRPRILGVRDRRDAARAIARAAGARRGSSTGSSSASATTPRSTATAGSTRRPWTRRCGRSRSTTRASTRRTGSCSPRSSRSSRRAGRRRRRWRRSLAEEVETIEDVYEPFLLRLGFLDRTPQGRIATEPPRAPRRLGYEIPPPRRASRMPASGRLRPAGGWTAAVAGSPRRGGVVIAAARPRMLGHGPRCSATPGDS